MTEAAFVIEQSHVPVVVRRFQTSDLSSHGAWILKRLQLLFRDTSEQWIGGWMRGLIANNEHSCLYQSHAVALFQVVNVPGLKPGKMIQERFVWVEDKTDKEQVELAADFYDSALSWGQGLRAERIIVCENSDVSKEEIQKRIGRIFDTKVSYVRL